MNCLIFIQAIKGNKEADHFKLLPFLRIKMVPPDLPSSNSSAKSSRDYVTPHKISLLVLIKEFCVVRHRSLHKRAIPRDENLWEHTNLHNRHFASTMLKLIQNPDMDLKQLNNILHPILHPKTYEVFISRLQKLSKNGVAAIMDYIATLDSLLVEPAPVLPIVQKSSVLGLFIRHMLLAFDKLSFSLVTKLCTKVRIYYDTAFGQCLEECSDISIGDSPLDEKLDESSCDEFQVLASQKQAEFFIAQQAALLQMNEGSALSPFELQEKIKELLKGNPELYEACYLSYMNFLRVKEYCGARDNLFHHFDRKTTVPQECKSTSASEDLSRSSRYAALNLAILHSLFGHKEEALAALNEAIMVAQEANDNICLQYSLAWLYRLNSDNKETLIEGSVAKSTELGLWCLSSLGIQALTKLKSFTTVLPSSVFELLTKSDVHNCQHSMTDLIGPAYTLRAGLWAYYGHSMMMNLSSEMLLYLNTSDPIRGGTYYIGEGTCLALRNMALYYASEGHYAESSSVLALARELFPYHSEHSHIWQLADLLIKFEKFLYQGKWVKALQTQKGISVFDVDEGSLRKAQLFLYQGNHSEANDILKKLLEKCENSDVSPHFHVRVLLLRSELLCDASSYVVALPTLMTCLSKCDLHHLLHLGALTKLQVAVVQLELGLPEQALNLLDEVFVTLLTHGSAYDKGLCCYLHGRCVAFAAMQGKENKDDDAFKKRILFAISMNKKALEYLKKVKASEKMKLALYWQAQMYNFLGMNSERNNAAYRFRNLEDELT
ncbi:anaphase-promoting complex subunit 5-like [Uloborus diversus]|uniref:anaphase-promoting complex subunit 5-like n=1 Tax=Uloborus diversus TaxID=327109 RepID=UPI002409A9D8|nr:anaphase-promoting complex subunit 5-like [Uloborus diversus]